MYVSKIDSVGWVVFVEVEVWAADDVLRGVFWIWGNAEGGKFFESFDFDSF